MGCEFMKGIFKIEGIFYVFKEWTIVINNKVVEEIKEYKMDDEIFLLTSDNKVITSAIFTNHLKQSRNGNLSIGLIVDSNIESEKIKESRKFAFKKDLI